MEYLTINGALRLKPSIDELRLTKLIQQLHNTAFERQGYIEIERNDLLLDVSAEGEISGDMITTVLDLLSQLKQFTTQDSLIVINRVHWEFNVLLRHRNNGALPLTIDLPGCVNGQECSQLIWV